MSAFGKIIGYELVKHDLIMMADVLSNTEKYSALGAHTPKALLLYGKPGVGKTLMAKCLIKESNRSTFTCRKNESGETFIKSIKRTYAKAKQQAPSIVFLDDLDKFSNAEEWRSDTEEYVAVQSCIDDVGDAEVFTLATANNIKCLPQSLLRSGRLGNKIEVDCPDTDDARKIIKHYLDEKDFSSDVDLEQFVRIMGSRSCADLEAVVNEARLLAAYERSDKLNTLHLVKAVLSVLLQVPARYYDTSSNKSKKDKTLEVTAYHEAGHAIAAESLNPGSVSLVSLYSADSGDSGGITITVPSSEIGDSIEDMERGIIISLAGRAAVEQRFGYLDSGTEKDLEQAFKKASVLVSQLCLAGFGLHTNGYDDSEELSARQEQAISHEVGRCYYSAKRVIASNQSQLDLIAKELLEKKLLLIEDVRRANISHTALKVS